MSMPVRVPITVVDQLGTPIPNTPHAVSVCLPTWQDNVDYEEGLPRVHQALRSGYPRFVYHAHVRKLMAHAESQFANPDKQEKCSVFASLKVAEQCRDFILAIAPATDPSNVRVTSMAFPDVTIYVVVYPGSLWRTAKHFWQHSGEIISSRLAEFALRQGRPLNEEEEIDSYVEEHYGRNLSWSSANAARNALKRRISDISGERKNNVYLYASGMAAIYNAHRCLRQLRPDLIGVMFGFPYLDTLKILQKFGKGGAVFYPFGDSSDIDKLRKLLEGGQRILGLFTEFPSNPLLKSADLDKLRQLAIEFDFPIVVDDTLGSFSNVNVMPYVDIVVTSLTKTFSGDSNVMGGSLVLRESGRYFAQLKSIIEQQYEELLWSEDAIFLERNSRTFLSRTKLINQTAEFIADSLKQHPKVGHVYYPKFICRAEYDAVKLVDGGYGALLSVTLKNIDQAPVFFDALQVCKGPSLGTNFTLCCPYTILAHYDELDFAEQAGVSRYLVRISIGLEDKNILWQRIEQALENVK